MSTTYTFLQMPAPSDPEFLNGNFYRGRAGFSYPVETYPTWIILGCLEGQFDFAIGHATKTTCAGGDFVVCSPGVPLHRKTRGTISFYFLRFKWGAPRAAGGRYSPADPARVDSTLRFLESISLREQDHASQQLANHLLTDLLLQRTFAELSSRTKMASPDALMLMAAHLLNKELCEPDNLDRLAERLAISPSQFSRRFTTAFGMSPVNYRTRLRVDHSKRLLLESTLTLQQIAEACGYENAFYFSRVFTRVTGERPSAYRKSRRV